MIKNIFVCADDYSQNETISEGILLLAQAKRINALSCLVNVPLWHECSNDLKQINTSPYIGLHLNLTFGQALSHQWRAHYSLNFPTLSTLIKQSYLRDLNRDCIDAELHAQLDAFREQMGKDPDFIDGHQHIHQLPMIRDALLTLYQQKKLNAFCRSTVHSWRDFLNFPKPLIITLLGGLAFKRRLKQYSIPANSSFAGAYYFEKASDYRRYFKHFLNLIHSEGLIMCHPGLESNHLSDPLYQYRPYEFNYLMSTDYLTDLHQAHCHLIAK